MRKGLRKEGFNGQPKTVNEFLEFLNPKIDDDYDNYGDYSLTDIKFIYKKDYVSKVEHGIIFPSTDFLFLIHLRFNVSLDYLSENEFFNDEKECRFYMETKLIQYIHNYITNEVTELEELMEIKQLIQRQKIERMMKVHKEMRGLDRYREQPKEYKYHDPYDDWIFRQLADIDSRNNIPDTSPQLDFDETDYEDYLKEKWNRGL